MQASQELTIPIGKNMQLAAKAWGPENGTPVIAVHGWLDNANSFDVIAPLIKGARVVAIDIRGHGRSSHIDKCDSYILLDIVRDIFLVADYLGWEKFSLLGHSMGGAACTLAAGTVPKRIRKLATLCILTPFEAQEAVLPFELEASITKQPQLVTKPPKYYPDLDALVANRVSNVFFPISEAAAQTIMERGAVEESQGFRVTSDIRLRMPFPIRLTEGQVSGFLARIECPVQFLMEEKGLFPLEFLEARIAKIKNIQHHKLTGSHHAHMEDEAVAIAEILEPFFSHD